MTRNAILIYCDGGEVKTRICRDGEAQSALVEAHDRGEPATAFIGDGNWDQEMLMSVSPDLKKRVGEAVNKVHRQLSLKLAMDGTGVPPDLTLRKQIYQAVQKWEEARAA